MVEPQRGEVWWVRLDPTLGSEIAKTRPCVILSGNVYNRLRRTVVVIPLSRSPQASVPLLVPVRCDGRDVVAVTDQIRAVAKAETRRHGRTVYRGFESRRAGHSGGPGVVNLQGLG